jgi:hypothetical protein
MLDFLIPVGIWGKRLMFRNLWLLIMRVRYPVNVFKLITSKENSLHLITQ